VLVCDCRFIDVEEDETIIVDDLVFEPPPECEDGIDNDRDGLVDQRDPGCRLAGRESDDVSTVQFQLRIGLLGNNPNVVCSGLNIARYLISFDDQILDDPLCSAVPSFFSVDAAAGEYEVTVVAIDAAGEPRTTTWTQTIEIPEGGGGSFELDVQFDDITFLEPIVAGAPMTLSFIPQADQPAHGCISGGLGSDLTEVRIHVLDAHGGELDPPVLLEDGVTPLVGQWIPCPAATLETEPLAWGGYLAHIEARNATGDVCFATADPIPLAPRVSRPLRVPAVPDAPESCR
jgi:hypothetical protein